VSNDNNEEVTNVNNEEKQQHQEKVEDYLSKVKVNEPQYETFQFSDKNLLDNTEKALQKSHQVQFGLISCSFYMLNIIFSTILQELKVH